MKIKSRLFDTISGSVGDITGAMGLGGAYFKDKTRPANPNSPMQQAQRGRMSAANVAWKTISATIREAWRVYGATRSRLNQTGATVTDNGWTAFSGAYTILGQNGEPTAPILLKAPAGTGFANFGGFTLSNVDVGGVATLAIATGLDAPSKLSIFDGGVTTPTRNTHNRWIWKELLEPADNAATNTTIALVAGRNWVRILGFTSDGQLGRGFIGYIDVA